MDGNKRVGAMAAELLLAISGLALAADDEDLVATTMAVAGGEISAEALAVWMRQRTRPLEA